VRCEDRRLWDAFLAWTKSPAMARRPKKVADRLFRFLDFRNDITGVNIHQITVFIDYFNISPCLIRPENRSNKIPRSISGTL
jgi:hypothetical protein